MNYKMTPILKFTFILTSLLFSTLALAAPQQRYSISSKPDWVLPVTANNEPNTEQQNNSNGVSYQLLDNQWKVHGKEQTHYHHLISKALNSSGVESVSQISIEFDPEYEFVRLHQLKIHRDGKSLDKLKSSRINVIQREKDLDYKIYDGTQTLNIFIDDVRPEDIVEYSYSIVGSNPVFSGHYANDLQLRWSVPVNHVYYRLLWPKNKKLHLKYHNTALKPVVRTVASFKEYVWNESNVKELVSDKDIPSWYEPFPIIYLSDLATWKEVGKWALPLFQPRTDTPATKKVINTILHSTKTNAQRALAALHFVQDEVRYLGIEMGIRSHKPNAPDAVITQRYGDCKDKSRLLVSLLKGLGIKASPALVNSYSGIPVKNALPTPTAFNHVIVRANIDGKDYWLDPTRTHQGNNLDTIYQPDYDYALVLSGKNSGLISMDDETNKVYTKEVEETIDVSGKTDKPAQYTIVTQYDKYYAESLRDQLSGTSISKVQKSFLNYTAQYFPNVKSAGKLAVADDAKKNIMTVTEKYSVPDIWSLSDDKRYLTINFEPFLINDVIKKVSAPIRTMPYAIAHPLRYEHVTHILVPKGSQFDNEFTQIDDKAFRFTKRVSFANDELVIKYLYETLSDHVNPEDIKKYAKDIHSAINLSSYPIQMPNPSLGAASENTGFNDINWLAVSILLASLAVILFLGVKFIYMPDLPYTPPSIMKPKLEGIGGWLILPLIGLVATPIRIAVGSKDFLYIFSAHKWAILADQFDTGFLVLILVEIIMNVAMIVFALLLIVMFFSRRTTFPRFFIAFLWFSFLINVADLLVIHIANYPGIDVEQSDQAELTRTLLSGIIWTFYFIYSERVKMTFNRNRKHSTAHEEPANLEESISTL